MRRRIRLTGRRQLSKSAVRVRLSEIGGRPLLTMTISQPEAFQPFPVDARVSLRLVENKKVEVVDLGTVKRMSTTRELQSPDFVAPSCQLRIADPGTKAKGLLLASTDNWTLRGDDNEDNENSQGILQFLADDTAPQSWKLEIRESDYPLVRVDKRIPNAALWAKNDPIFVGIALPSIVRQIFDEIMREEYPDDLPWVSEWVKWAEAIMPAQAPPIGEDKPMRFEYIDRLLNSFCSRHDLAERLLKEATPEDMQ